MTSRRETPDRRAISDLETFRNPVTGAIDLTDEVYKSVLAELRRKSPSLARRAERAVQRRVPQAVPRHRVPWQDTSEGLRVRLRFLPANPHVEVDVGELRRQLGLNPDALDGDMPEELRQDSSFRGFAPPLSLVVATDPVEIRRSVLLSRAGEWLRIHREAVAHGPNVAQGSSGANDAGRLSEAARQSAIGSAAVDLDGCDTTWLREGPSFSTPLETAVARLCIHNNLPFVRGGQLERRLAMFALTDEAALLHDVGFVTVLAELGATGWDPAVFPFGVFAIAVACIDEYFTEDDWDEVWRHYVVPRQSSLRDQRGSERVRRPNSLVLERALPMYRRMVLDGLTDRQAIADARLLGSIPETTDDKTIRHRLRELKRLLSPARRSPLSRSDQLPLHGR